MSSGECKGNSILFKLFSIFFTYQSIQCNPCLVGKRLLHFSTHLFGFSTVCLGFVNGSCPVQTHSSALSAGAVGGFAQRHVKKRGRRYSREKTACLHPPPLLAYVELGFKPETFKSTTSLSLPLRPLPASPRGCVTRGLLKSAYGPGKKKKVLTFHTAENLNKCELQC